MEQDQAQVELRSERNMGSSSKGSAGTEARQRLSRIKELRVRAKEKRDAESGQSTLFDLDPATIQIETLSWEPTVPWDPTTRPWW